MHVCITGLDARAAAIVMRTVRNIVNTGRTIVCTIHQPSIDIFESFDELLLLKRGGETIFNGQLGKNSQLLIDYFQVTRLVPTAHGVQQQHCVKEGVLFFHFTLNRQTHHQKQLCWDFQCFHVCFQLGRLLLQLLCTSLRLVTLVCIVSSIYACACADVLDITVHFTT